MIINRNQFLKHAEPDPVDRASLDELAALRLQALAASGDEEPTEGEPVPGEGEAVE